MNKSLKEKIQKVYDLSIEIAYKNIDEGKIRKLDSKFSEQVFGWVDGLNQKFIMDRIEGHCSLQAMLMFDMTECEQWVDEEIKCFEKFLNQKKEK